MATCLNTLRNDRIDAKIYHTPGLFGGTDGMEGNGASLVNALDHWGGVGPEGRNYWYSFLQSRVQFGMSLCRRQRQDKIDTKRAVGPGSNLRNSVAQVFNLEPCRRNNPNPPEFETAATNSGDDEIGAEMIGSLMPSKWHSGVVNIAITFLPL